MARELRLQLALAALAGLFLAASVPAYAAEPDPVMLEGMIVTATREETPVQEVPRSISAVDADRIQNGTQQLGLDEALVGIPGLYMQNRYNFAQDLRVSLRGFGARSNFGIRGIKILVDGIPETLPDGQAGVDSIDLGSAQRIEVLRGPSSSLYGNAAGGVISVTSELGNADPYVEGRAAVGEGDYSQQQLKSAGLLDSTRYLFNVSRTELKGFRDHSEAEGTVINSKFGIDLGEDDDLILSINLTDQPEAEDAGGVTAAQARADRSAAHPANITFDAGEALEQQRVGGVYRRRSETGELTVRNYYVWRDFTNRLAFTSGGTVELDRFFAGGGLQYAFAQLPEGAGLMIGADFDRQDDDRERFDNNNGNRGAMTFDQNEEVQAVGFFTQGHVALTEAWTMHAGLRYDEVSYDISDRFRSDGDDSGKLGFDAFSPSLSVNRRVDRGVLFATYSSSFETPTTTELANPTGAGGFNRDLEAQTADNFEIGYKFFSPYFYGEIAVFSIELDDELVPFELAAFPGRTFYSNAGSSLRRGVETALAWKPAAGFQVDASYTWSDFEFDDFVDSVGNDFGGKELPGVPKHFAYLGLSYKSPGDWSAVLEGFYSGDLYANNANTDEAPHYTVAHLRLVKEFGLKPGVLKMYLGLNNVFDEEYFGNVRINAFGGRYFEPAPERNVYGGLAFHF